MFGFVALGIVSSVLRDRLGRTSLKWPILSRMGCKILTDYSVPSSRMLSFTLVCITCTGWRAVIAGMTQLPSGVGGRWRKDEAGGCFCLVGINAFSVLQCFDFALLATLKICCIIFSFSDGDRFLFSAKPFILLFIIWYFVLCTVGNGVTLLKMFIIAT